MFVKFPWVKGITVEVCFFRLSLKSSPPEDSVAIVCLFKAPYLARLFSRDGARVNPVSVRKHLWILIYIIQGLQGDVVSLS
jgi:hypothetical protein